jgi:hypothetical protein
VSGNWIITNTSKASDITLVAGDGIQITQPGSLTWQITNTSKATDITLIPGPGIHTQRDGLNWVITNTEPVTADNSLEGFEIIAGDNIVIRNEGNKWLISAVHVTFTLCELNSCDIEGTVEGAVVSNPCEEVNINASFS